MKIKIKNDDPLGYCEEDSLAEINRGNSHIINDDHCYVVVNRVYNGNDPTDMFKPSAWIFREAVEAIRKLPLPTDP